jgi:hypothetical protein
LVADGHWLVLHLDARAVWLGAQREASARLLIQRTLQIASPMS